VTNDWEDASLTPYERETVAWMEEELDLRDSADGAGRGGVAGGAVAAFGAVVAFSAAAPLALAGWILLVIGFFMVWEGSG
jgi:hypothetical protein